MPTERFDVNLVLKAQRSGEAAFAQTEAGIKVVREAVKKFSEAQANGIVIADAYKLSIKGFKDDALKAGLAFEGEAQAVRDATRAIDRFRESEAAGLPFDEAVTAATTEETVAKEEETAATEASTGANSASIPTWVAMAVGITAVILVLWPFIAAITSAAVAVISFVVAGAGALILLAAMAVGIGAVGVAILALSSWTPAWAGQIQRLETRFKAVAVVLEKATVPMLKQMIGFLIGLAPLVQQIGLSIEAWFGARLPGILKGISQVIKDLTPDFKAFASVMSKEFDRAGPVVQQFFEIMVRGGLGAVSGLFDNLTRLANWFNQESPKWQPIWDAIGRAIQWVASTWATFNDWIVSNWPATMSQVQQFIDQIREGWEKWGPPLTLAFGLVMQFVQIGLQAIIDHGEVLVPLLLGLALTFLVVVAAIAIIVGAFVIAADAIANFLSNTNGQFTNWANSVIGMINAVIEGLNRIPGVHINPVPLIGLGAAVQRSQTISGGATGTRGNSGRSTGNLQYRHSGGDVRGGEVYIVGGPGAEEIFLPNSSGRIIPATAATSSGTDTSGIEGLLKQVVQKLDAILRDAPAVSGAAMVRRGG